MMAILPPTHGTGRIAVRNSSKPKKKTLKMTSLGFEPTQTKRLASRFSLKGYLEPKWLRYKLDPDGRVNNLIKKFILKEKRIKYFTPAGIEPADIKRLASRFSLKGYLEPKWLRYKLEPLVEVANSIKKINLTESNRHQHNADDRGPALAGQFVWGVAGNTPNKLRQKNE